MLGFRFVVLVLHLEHDGNDFFACFGVALAEYEVALRAFDNVVIFFKVCMRERRSSNFVELDFAVLFERFAHHFRRKTRLHFFHAGNFVVFVLDEFIFLSKLMRHLLA